MQVVWPNYIFIKSHSKSSNYDYKSLVLLGPKIWNQLTKNFKSETCFSKFKKYIDTWFGPKCKCNICGLTYFIKLWHGSNHDKYHSLGYFLVKICKLVKQNAALWPNLN